MDIYWLQLSADLDDAPSVISSIVKKILEEAILEINEEIQVYKLRNLASEVSTSL